MPGGELRKLGLHTRHELNHRRKTQLTSCPLLTNTLLPTKTGRKLPAHYQPGTCLAQHSSSMESPPASGNAQTQESTSTLREPSKTQNKPPSKQPSIAIQPSSPK